MISHDLWRINVSTFGRTDEWTIYVERVEMLVNTDRVDAWSRVIWAYGSCPSDMSGGFQYRKASDTEWIDVPTSGVTQTSGAVVGCIKHLSPLTEYVVRAVAATNIGNEVKVTTDATADIPDGSFDQWWLKNNKIWCPWNEDGNQYWDTGNTGCGYTRTKQCGAYGSHVDGKGQAAELNTKFVGIGPVGKLAAGSIYTLVRL